MTHLLTSTATLAAFLGILRTDRSSLQAMLGTGSCVWLVTLVRPDLWTPEVYGATECALALCAVLAGLGAARRAHVRAEITFRGLLCVLVAAAFCLLWVRAVPIDQHWQYRGVAFVDLAACALLATIGSSVVVYDYLDSVAVRWLALAFGLTCVQLLAFEVNMFVSRAAGWGQAGAWLIAMLLIARAGLSHSGPPSGAPGPSAGRPAPTG